jgi:pimeloyl-ACP methyl ester carboxylesterase
MKLFMRIVLIGFGVLLVALVGGWLALQRPDIPYATLEAKYANAQSRFMDLPGGLHVHYRDQGARDGPVVVMVHGFSASLHAWEPWVRHLGDRYRIITLDLPAHGLTRAPATYQVSLDRYAEVVDAVATRLGAQRYVVVGNSMGGGAAWTLALKHPDHLRGLVLVDSVGPFQRPGGSGGRGGGDGSPMVFRMLGSPIGRALLRNIDTHALAERGLKQAYVDPALVTPALVDRYVELSRAPGHRDILLNGQGQRQAVSPSALAAIRTPTLVMHGEVDSLIPVSAGRALAAAIPGARLITYPGVGHVPMEQIPARSAQDLRAFLDAL